MLWLAPVDDELTELFDALRGALTVNAAAVAVVTWLAYDISLTLWQEVEFMWASRFSAHKCLYFMIRYFTFVNLCIQTGAYTMTGLPDSFCRVWLWYFAYAGPIFTSMMGDMLLVLRLWAAYDGQRWAHVLCAVAYIADTGVKITGTALLVSTVGFAPIPEFIKKDLPGCWFGEPRYPFLEQAIWIYHTMTCCIYLTLSVLKFLSGVRTMRLNFRQTRELRPTLHLFVRDNSVYFLLVVAGSVTWLILQLRVADPTAQLGLNFFMATYCITASRLVLNLRRSTRTVSFGDISTGIVAASPVRIGDRWEEGDAEMSVLQLTPTTPEFPPPTTADGLLKNWTDPEQRWQVDDNTLNEGPSDWAAGIVEHFKTRSSKDSTQSR